MGDGSFDRCETCDRFARLGRRRFLAVLGLGLAAVLDACTAPARAKPAAVQPSPPVSNPIGTTAPPRLVELDVIPDAHPGRAKMFSHAIGSTEQIAITIDDGYCQECVDAYVGFARQTGIHITFSPNGAFGSLWEPHAQTLRPLIEAGQVQIANHTFNHPDLTKLSSSRVQTELERNEAWIERTFGITARPWYRPPFGFHNRKVDAIAAQLGFGNVLLWNGSFGDSVQLTPEVLMAQAVRYLQPGTIMLGHANHPSVTTLFPQLQELMAKRGLQPVTLDEMFGTSRALG